MLTLAKTLHMSTLPTPTVKTIELSSSIIESFQRDGHVCVKNVLTPGECSRYRQLINDAVRRFNTETRSLSERDTYGKAFLQTMNLWEVDKDVAKFTLSEHFAGIAAALLGVNKVRLYHDQALYKEPGGGFTPWHQDQYYWPLDTPNTVTMWMPLIDIIEEMGMIGFASGSHKNGFVGNLAISDESETLLEQHIKQQQYPIQRAKSMRAGDTSWHYGWTLHNAPGNQSSITREVMTIIYFADGAHVTAPKNTHQEADRQRWLGSLDAGSLAASSLNPLL